MSGNLTRRYFVWNSATLKALGYQSIRKANDLGIYPAANADNEAIRHLRASRDSLSMLRLSRKIRTNPKKTKTRTMVPSTPFQIPAAPSCF